MKPKKIGRPKGTGISSSEQEIINAFNLLSTRVISPSGREIAKTLSIDPSYVNRVIKKYNLRTLITS
jgi:DNA-binding MarR family transcriptional regulator